MIIEYLDKPEHQEVPVFIISDIRVCTLRAEQAIPLLPHPQGVSFDSCQFCQIADTIISQNLSK
jgi:hypothetical protein